MRLFHLSLLLASTAQTVTAKTIVIGATKDNTLRLNETDDNFGGDFNLDVVGDGERKRRPIIYFPLEGLFANGKLLSATLQMVIQWTRSTHIRCTKAGSVGCASVHTIKTPWGEGLGCGGERNCTSITLGESSWLHSAYPITWDTPGGDFDPDPIGYRSPETHVASDSTGRGKIAGFPLDVNRVTHILHNATLYFGFLLMDDQDPGFVLFESRHCLGSSIGQCPSGVGPLLVLEFEDEKDRAPAMVGWTLGTIVVMLVFVVVWRRHRRNLRAAREKAEPTASEEVDSLRLEDPVSNLHFI